MKERETLELKVLELSERVVETEDKMRNLLTSNADLQSQVRELQAASLADRVVMENLQAQNASLLREIQRVRDQARDLAATQLRRSPDDKLSTDYIRLKRDYDDLLARFKAVTHTLGMNGITQRSLVAPPTSPHALQSQSSKRTEYSVREPLPAITSSYPGAPPRRTVTSNDSTLSIIQASAKSTQGVMAQRIHTSHR